MARAFVIRKRRAAGMSQSLRACFAAYRAAFAKDLDHFWSGLAALQTGAIFLDLSETNETWRSRATT